MSAFQILRRFAGAAALGLVAALSSCATQSGAIVTMDNATRTPITVNVSNATVDRINLMPREGAEMRFEETFPESFSIIRGGRYYNYRMTVPPEVLKHSALVVSDDMVIFLAQDGQVSRFQPEGFPLYPLK